MTARAGLSQTQIEYAMSNTMSNRQAALFLSVHYKTYKKYATIYRCLDNPDMTLFEKQRLKHFGKGIGISRTHSKARKHTDGFNLVPLQDILEGKRPNYNIQKLQKRLIDATILQPRCSNCGYTVCRIIDNQFPLLLHHKDGNVKNHVLGNLELLCLNCWFVYVGDIPRMGVKKMVKPTLGVDQHYKEKMKQKIERFEQRTDITPEINPDNNFDIPSSADMVPNKSEDLTQGLSLSTQELERLAKLAAGAIK